MNWWKRFWSNPYRWGLWHWIGGRQWTFIRRDIYHLVPLANIVLFVSVGFFSGIFYIRIMRWVIQDWWHPIALVAIMWFIGVLQGHFYWSKKWEEGEGK